MIYLYLKILDNFVCFILKDRFWFGNTTLGSMVKFQLLAKFPVDQLANPVLSSLVLFLC